MFRYYRRLSVFAVAAMSLIMIAGCDRRTPEERLAAASQFYQEGDQLSAEMEALKVIEKAPDEPIAIDANVLLARIYAGQNRFEEAELQLETALDNVSQLEPGGKELLKMYLGMLQGQENYDKALEVVDEYQKEYAEDAGTSLSLRVASADIRMAAGRTTESRQIIQSLIDETTAPAEIALYKDLYVRTFLRDQDTTAAINYLEPQFSQAQRPEDKRSMLLTLAGLYAQNGNYEKSRTYLEGLTTQFSQMVRSELDKNNRLGQSISLAQAYMQLGNLPGARRVLQTVYDAGVSDAQMAAPVVMGLAENLLRMGETSATVAFLTDAEAKYPSIPFGQQRQQLEDLIAKGQLQQVAPVDTSPLTMQYRNDPNVLWPADLPGLLGVETTGTATGETTGATSMETTATLAPETPAEGTTAVEVPDATTTTAPESATTASEDEAPPPTPEAVSTDPGTTTP